MRTSFVGRDTGAGRRRYGIARAAASIRSSGFVLNRHRTVAGSRRRCVFSSPLGGGRGRQRPALGNRNIMADHRKTTLLLGVALFTLRRHRAGHRADDCRRSVTRPRSSPIPTAVPSRPPTPRPSIRARTSSSPARPRGPCRPGQRCRDPEDPARDQPAEGAADAARRDLPDRRSLGQQRTEYLAVHPRFQRAAAGLHARRPAARRSAIRQLQRPVAAARDHFRRCRPGDAGLGRGRSGHRVDQQPGRHDRHLLQRSARRARRRPLSQTFGSYSTFRTYARIDSGDLGDGTKFYVSGVRQDAHAWDFNGKQGGYQADAKIVHDDANGKLTAYFVYSDKTEPNEDATAIVVRPATATTAAVDNRGDGTIYPAVLLPRFRGGRRILPVARLCRDQRRPWAPTTRITTATRSAPIISVIVKYDWKISDRITWSNQAYFHHDDGVGVVAGPITAAGLPLLFSFYYPGAAGSSPTSAANLTRLSGIFGGSGLAARTTEYRIDREGGISTLKADLGNHHDRTGRLVRASKLVVVPPLVRGTAQQSVLALYPAA